MANQSDYNKTFLDNPIHDGELKARYYERIATVTGNKPSTIKEKHLIYSRTKQADQIKNITQTVNSGTFAFLKGENVLNIPEPFDDNVEYFNLPYFGKIAFLTDIHLPFYHKQSLIIAIEAVKKYEPDCIWLNGDIADSYAISRWQKERKYENLQYEIDCVRDFLKFLKETFPRAVIYYKLGNHEERWDRYITENAKALLGISALDFKEVFGLTANGVHFVDSKTITKTGKLHILHGHEVHGGGGVFPARSMFLKTFKSTIFGHVHRASEYVNKAIDDEVVACWSVASLSLQRPGYSPVNQYGNGFAFIDMHTDGNFQVTNRKIIDGRIY